MVLGQEIINKNRKSAERFKPNDIHFEYILEEIEYLEEEEEEINLITRKEEANLIQTNLTLKKAP